jgi:hypothetical protein
MGGCQVKLPRTLESAVQFHDLFLMEVAGLTVPSSTKFVFWVFTLEHLSAIILGDGHW